MAHLDVRPATRTIAPVKSRLRWPPRLPARPVVRAKLRAPRIAAIHLRRAIEFWKLCPDAHHTNGQLTAERMTVLVV